MAVNLSNIELKQFADNGIGVGAIRNTVNLYRQQGLDDSAIRTKIDNKLTEFAGAEYGADNVARAREAVAGVRAGQDSEFRPVAATARFLGENPVGRAVTSVVQGANKGNPLVQLASLIPGLETVNDNIIEQENGFERALDTAAQFATPAGVSAKAVGAIGKLPKVANALSKSRVGRFAAGTLTPAAMPLEYAGAAGAGALTGAVNPESTVGQIATGLVGGLAGAGTTSLINAFGPAKLKNFIGRGALRDELRNAMINNERAAGVKNWRTVMNPKGADVSDVNFGKLSKSQQQILNRIRTELGQPPITNPNVLIPSNTIRHLVDKRVIGDGLPIRNVVKDLENAIHGTNSKVSRQLSNVPGRDEIQAFVDVSSNPYSVGFSRNQAGQPEITSAFRMREKEAIKKFPDIIGEKINSTGTPGPQNTLEGGSPGRFTDLSNNSIINPNDPNVKRAFRKLEKDIGRERLQEMLSTGRPLLDQNSTTINDLARQARDVSPQAAERLTERIGQNQVELPTMIRDTIDDVFGSTNTIKNAEDLAARFDPLATSQYEAAFTNIGRNPMTGGTRQTNARLPQNQYEQLNKNPYIRDAISTAPNVHKELQNAGRRAIKDEAGNITGYEQIAAPRNEMRRLDFAKEVLDNQIARERAAPAPNTRLIASLTNAKNQLVNTMDKFSPQYAKARATSMQKLSALEAQELGKRWNWADNSVAQFKNTVDGMTDDQLRSFRLGLRDSIENKMGETPVAFAAQLLRKNTQDKLKIALGDESARKLTDMATRIRGEFNTRNRVTGGSMTSTNLGNSVADMIGTVEQVAASPIKAPGRLAARWYDTRRARNTYNALTDIMLTNPKNIKLPPPSATLSDVLNNIGKSASERATKLPAGLLPQILLNLQNGGN
jgi:hypothetical protein